LAIRLSPSLSSLARLRELFLARGFLSDHRRFKRLDVGDGARRRRLRVSVNKIAQMQETRDAVLAALAPRLG
jgi:hypothetical protein